MSIKFKLFAGVAAPLVSLPLVLQPALAAPPRAAIEQQAAGDVVRVQEQLIVPPGAAPQEEEQQQEAPPEEAPPAEEPPAEEAPQEAPAEEPAPEAAPEPAPEPQQEAPAEVQPEAPAPEPEVAPEPEPEPEPEAAPEPEAPADEPAPEAEQPAPEAEEPQQEEAPAAPEAEPEAEQAPAAEEQQAPAEETPAEEAPAEEAPADAAPEAPAAETPAEEAPAEQQPGATGEAPAEQPATEAPADGTTAPDATAPADGGTAAPEGAPVEGAPAEGAPGEGAPAQDGAAAPAAGQPVEQALPPAPTTPEEIERARAIADDPSQAQEGQTVVLPVENGAAVLDSQKETVTTTTTTTTTTTPGAPAAPGQAPAQAPVQAAAPVAPPTSDAEAQAPLQERGPVELRAVTAEQGERIEGRPEFRRLSTWDYRDDDNRRERERRGDRGGDRWGDWRDDDTRVIINIDNRTVVRHDDSSRFYRDSGEVYYERLPGERYREVVDREGGVQVVTIRNSYGTVVQRSRIVDGEEYVLYYAPELYEEDDYQWRDPAQDLPPMRLTVPLDEYIIDTSSDPDRDYYEFLEQPPVERVERVYSLDEVRYSARIRDKARRIDLDTITFATGSAEIPMNQARSLRKVAEAMNKILENNPAETFLIEGHTDAVGSDESNLILSDERAESVAVVLTEAFGIAPENLTTQGYGERYLKVRTEAEEQQNRRVTIRRITPLVKPVASNQ